MALADFDKAIALNPDSARAYKFRGGAYLLTDRGYDVADLARSVEHEMKKNVASVYGVNPDFERAIADFTS